MSSDITSTVPIVGNSGSIQNTSSPIKHDSLPRQTHTDHSKPISNPPTPKHPTTGNVVGGTGVDLDRLARAVARHESNNCTSNIAKTYRNCHGIKSGNTYPCKSGKNNMCIFSSHEESYKAFKIIWAKWYKTLPTMEQAGRYSGHDNALAWYKNVNLFYKTQNE